jgi:hypothetical protein
VERIDALVLDVFDNLVMPTRRRLVESTHPLAVKPDIRGYRRANVRNTSSRRSRACHTQ